MGVTASSTSAEPAGLPSIGALAEHPATDIARVLRTEAAALGGLRKLVDLRADVLARLGGDPTLATLADELRKLMQQHFAPEHLQLRSIGPDAPDALLDRLTRYEAVHAVRDREDLLRRLHPADRRCFGLFHPGLDDDPLVFVEVALTVGIEASVQAIIDAPAPEEDLDADTAVFYSINSCQAGLKNIPFGAELLHRVLDELATTTVTTCSTLSPIPGFARWLGGAKPADEDALLEACARYLLIAKRSGRPLDPVARFHLGNGARLHRLNPGGDTSERGLTRYLGVTANYLYEPEQMEANAAAYRRGELVASDAIRSLAQP